MSIERSRQISANIIAVPSDGDQRSIHIGERIFPGDAQPEIVVFGPPVSFVEATDSSQAFLPHHDRGGSNKGLLVKLWIEITQDHFLALEKMARRFFSDSETRAGESHFAMIVQYPDLCLQKMRRPQVV